MILRSGSILGHLGSILGHQASSKENLFNTVEVTFLKYSSRILLKMFILVISRSSSELGHGVKKTQLDQQTNSKENLVNIRGLILEVIIMILAHNVYLDYFSVKFETGSFGGHNINNIVNTRGHIF